MTCPIDEAPEPRPITVLQKPEMSTGGTVLIGTMAQQHEDPIEMRTCIAYKPGNLAPRYLETVKVPRRIIESIMLLL